MIDKASISYMDLCRNCNDEAYTHTTGVFYYVEEVSLKDLVRLLPEKYWAGSKCRNFEPKDNILYLEWKYEQSRR